MRFRADISVQLTVPTEATVTFEDSIEVSLDCPICQRCRRTVILTYGEKHGFCCPTNHQFPGQILDRMVTKTGRVQTVLYRVYYEYEPFTDAKYPDDTPSGVPTWARVRFGVYCWKCGYHRRLTTQNNLRRPRTASCTSCGKRLYKETQEMPLISAEALDVGENA